MTWIESGAERLKMQSARRGRPPGAELMTWSNALEQAEDDGADEGERDVRGHNAQLAQQRTREIHWTLPWFTSLPALTQKLASGSRPKKSALLPSSRFPRDAALRCVGQTGGESRR